MKKDTTADRTTTLPDPHLGLYFRALSNTPTQLVAISKDSWRFRISAPPPTPRRVVERRNLGCIE